MSGGGSGGSGEQKYNWNSHLEPRWVNALDRAQGQILDAPYQQYGGQRIAGLDDDQSRAMQYARNFVDFSGNPLPATDGARNLITDTVGGKYLRGPDSNSWAYSLNNYSGESPQFERMLDTGRQEITDAYQQGTAADTTRMFNMAGAFGGSAHQNAMANNQNALGKQLGNYEAGMRNDQYNRSAQLEEARFNRGSQAYEGERGRMQGAIPLGQAEQGLTNDRVRMLMGVGDADRSLAQDHLTQNYQDWLDQQNWAQRAIDNYTGILSRSQGGMSNMTSTQAGYGASPFSQLLGAGLLGYGMTR